MQITPNHTERVAASSTAQPLRTVAARVKSGARHWVGDGFHVSTYFPSGSVPSERVSPFVLMDYGPPAEFAPLAEGKRGVGWHPHRGFETVTVAFEGSVAHRDNAGHRGVIGPGDVQWMTAGAGIFHEEYHEEAFTRRGGRLHMLQLWVNLPKKFKAAAPAYQPIAAGDIPVVQLAGGGNVRVIAGDYEGTRGPARTFTPITLLDVTLQAGERFAVSLPEHFNALAVVASGLVATAEQRAAAGELVLFNNDGSRLELAAEVDSHVLILAGEPIDEPIVQYGPFVMNTVEEIQQAAWDVNRGKFGAIPD